jgi:hypothetical protein
MTKDKKVAVKSKMGRIKRRPSYRIEETSTPTYPVREIMTPVKRGTVSRLAIRKAVREVIAARSVSNAS